MYNEQEVESILENFLSELEQIPWFENIGQPASEDEKVVRIRSFAEWNGPEGYGESLQEEHIERWEKALFDSWDEREVQDIKEHWNHIEAIVFDLARTKVAYNPKDDFWCGPYAAVWFVTKVAALVGCTLIHFGSLPDKSADSQWNLSEIWLWLQRGHWPCAYHWPEYYWDKVPPNKKSLDYALECGFSQQLVVY